MVIQLSFAQGNVVLCFSTSPLCNISGTNGPTEMVRLSKFAGFHKKKRQKFFKGLTQIIKILIKVRLKI